MAIDNEPLTTITRTPERIVLANVGLDGSVMVSRWAQNRDGSTSWGEVIINADEWARLNADWWTTIEANMKQRTSGG